MIGFDFVVGFNFFLFWISFFFFWFFYSHFFSGCHSVLRMKLIELVEIVLMHLVFHYVSCLVAVLVLLFLIVLILLIRLFCKSLFLSFSSAWLSLYDFVNKRDRLNSYQFLPTLFFSNIIFFP